MSRSKAILFAIFLLMSHLLIAQECYVFIGSYNRNINKEGIYVYKLDTVTGKLTRISAVKGLLNPAYLTLSSSGHCVYACTEARIAGGGKLTAFTFDAKKGSLAFINDQKSEGENPVYATVHSSGKWLVNANYTGGAVSVYPLDEHGGIGAAAQVITFSDSSIDQERQRSAHIHAAVFSPDERYVFFPDLGADKIRCFAFDAAKPKPLQDAAYPFTGTVPGSGPRHFVFHPDKRYCYCIEEMSGCITVYGCNNGKLDSVQRIAIHKKGITGEYSSADIHISPDGRFLYASNRGSENNIVICAIDLQTGKLKVLGYQSVEGNHPRIFAIVPSGKFLLVANQVSGNVVVFKRNGKTGLLERTGTKIAIPGASCVQIKTY